MLSIRRKQAKNNTEMREERLSMVDVGFSRSREQSRTIPFHASSSDSLATFRWPHSSHDRRQRRWNSLETKMTWINFHGGGYIKENQRRKSSLLEVCRQT